MNRQLYELTGVTEKEVRQYCLDNNLKFYKTSTKQLFFKLLQEGKIVKNKDGKLINKKD